MAQLPPDSQVTQIDNLFATYTYTTDPTDTINDTYNSLKKIMGKFSDERTYYVRVSDNRRSYW